MPVPGRRTDNREGPDQTCTQPSTLHDERTIFPKQGKGAALIIPARAAKAMNLHLLEIAPGAHDVLLVGTRPVKSGEGRLADLKVGGKS
jgi:hypothetical protein